MAMEIRVLDHGYVRLIDFMGGDRRVAETARISTMTKGDEESDAKLIRYLIKMGHGTPFEHSYFTFYVKCPIFVARQWFRHRISSYNEMSMRYCVADREYYVPENLEEEERKAYVEAVERAFDTYDHLITAGIRKEQARGVLPTSVYTQFYWTVNARSLMNFLDLRLDMSAQYEIRQYARAIFTIFSEKMPHTAAAFRDLILGEMKRPITEKEI